MEEINSLIEEFKNFNYYLCASGASKDGASEALEYFEKVKDMPDVQGLDYFNLLFSNIVMAGTPLKASQIFCKDITEPGVSVKYVAVKDMTKDEKIVFRVINFGTSSGLTLKTIFEEVKNDKTCV